MCKLAPAAALLSKQLSCRTLSRQLQAASSSHANKQGQQVSYLAAYLRQICASKAVAEDAS